MPWKSGDAARHTKMAETPELRRLWMTVANQALARHGDDGRAIREANAVVAKRKKAKK